MASARAFGWFGPVSGILSSVLLAAAFAVLMGGGEPDADIEYPAAKIAEELEESRDALSASFRISGLALIFFLFFLGLPARLLSARGGAGRLACVRAVGVRIGVRRGVLDAGLRPGGSVQRG
jgi:hypothetical protein